MSTPVDTSAPRKTIESTPAVKITALEPRNNNSTFVGQIVEVEVVTKNGKKDNQPRRFLKGIVGDETGVVRFDLAERDGVSFKVGDIVRFDKAMNKVSKEKHHYIDVKRFGTYEVLDSHPAIKVNNDVNKSSTVVPPRENHDEQPQQPRVNKPRQNNHAAPKLNNNNNNNNNNRGSRTNNNNNNNNNSNNYNNNRNNNNNNNRSNYNNQKQNNEPRHPTFVRPTQISKLAPGTNEQVVLGQVVSFETVSKTLREREVHFVKGRIADQTGSINFDVKLSAPIRLNDVILFSNVQNKVDDKGFHYLTVGKFGFYNVVSTGSLDTTQENNLSEIEYVKKTV